MKIALPNSNHKAFIPWKSNIKMLVGVAFLLPSLQNIGILHHKKAKLRKHMRQSVYDLFYISVTLTCGATTSENCTYLTLAATPSVAATSCTYTICPASSTVSRIRLDLTVNWYPFWILQLVQLIISVYSHCPLDLNAKSSDTKCGTLSIRWFCIRIERVMTV